MPCLSGKFLFMRVCCPLVGIITILQRIFLEKIRGVGAGPLVKLPLSCGNSPGQPLASEAGELLWGLEAIAHLSVGYEWPGLGLPSSPLVALEVWPPTSSISISITWGLLKMKFSGPGSDLLNHRLWGSNLAICPDFNKPSR